MCTTHKHLCARGKFELKMDPNLLVGMSVTHQHEHQHKSFSSQEMINIRDLKYDLALKRGKSRETLDITLDLVLKIPQD